MVQFIVVQVKCLELLELPNAEQEVPMQITAVGQRGTTATSIK
jgi:hypothetical protein